MARKIIDEPDYIYYVTEHGYCSAEIHDNHIVIGSYDDPLLTPSQAIHFGERLNAMGQAILAEKVVNR
jgi:hypothetical protein